MLDWELNVKDIVEGDDMLMEVMYCFVIFLYSFKNASILLIIIVCAIGDGSVSRNEHELSLTSSI